MNDPEDLKFMQQWLFEASCVERYIAYGVHDELRRGVITEQEGMNILKLARIQTSMPSLFFKWLPTEEVNEMLTDTVILYKDGGQVLSKDVLVEASKDRTHSMTLASIQDGKIVHITYPGECDLDATVQIVQSNFKDVPLAVLFSKVETTQPFHVLGDEGDPDVVGFIQGDPAAIPHIVKEIGKIFKGADDFADFWTALQGSQDRLKMQIQGDGCFTLLNRDGGWFPCQNADIEVDHPWGCSYSVVQANDGGKPEEPAVEPKPADGPKGSSSPFGDLAKLKTNSGGNTPPTAAATKFPLPPSGVGVARAENKDSALPFKPGEEAWFRCPDTKPIPGGSSFRKLTREEVQAWHLENLGYITKNYKDKPIIPEAFRKAAQAPAAPATATSGAALATASGVKDVTPKHIPPPVKLDESTLKDFQGTFMVKVFGQNMEQIENLDIMFAELDDVPTVTEKLKLSETFFDGMPHTSRYHMCVEQPLVASRVLGDTNRRLHNMYKRNKELETNLEKEQAENAELRRQIEALKKPASPFGNLSKPKAA